MDCDFFVAEQLKKQINVGLNGAINPYYIVEAEDDYSFKVDDVNDITCGFLDELAEEIDGVIANLKELVFDMKGLEYISSAGLRVILKAQKIMNTKGSMKLTGVNDSIMEVFDITGFLDILTIE